MPNKNAPAGSRYSGWYMDKVNNVLEWYSNGTKVGQASGSTVTLSGNVTITGTSTLTGAQTLTGITTHSDELRVANGKNIRVGTINTFGTTEPTNAIIFKTGTEFAGAITTSGGLMSSNTVLRKIIADGTVSNVET